MRIHHQNTSTNFIVSEPCMSIKYVSKQFCECKPTCTSSTVCTMNMSWRSSMAPSIQLLKGADLLANSKNNWSIVSRSLSVRWEDYMISHTSSVFLNPPPASHLQLILRSHLHSSHTHPKTSPHLFWWLIPGCITIGGLVNPPKLLDDVEWKMDRKQTLSLSFRLNTWPFSQALKHLQVWNRKHGLKEEASGFPASDFTGRTLTSISPL